MLGVLGGHGGADRLGEITEGSIVLLATGAARFEVVRWLADDPFPRALVRELDGLELDAPTVSALAAAEALVRATIARASEFVELPWSADVVLYGERVGRTHLAGCGSAPLGSLDQFALLRSRTRHGAARQAGGGDAGGGRTLHRQVGRRRAGRRRLPSVTLAASGTADSAAVAGSGSHPARCSRPPWGAS